MNRTRRLPSVVCILLVLLSLPAHCDQFARIPITQRYESGVAIAAEDGLAASRSEQAEHHNSLKGPEGLALAGLLLMPLDHSLSKSMASNGNDGVTKAANSLGTAQVLVPALATLYIVGDKADKDASKTAVSALVDAAIMTQAMKFLAGRARPYMDDAGDFKGPGAGKGHDSFPSGHTSAAFAVATVLADKHPNQEWLYYGLASAVGVARIRKGAHFPSDVLVGAAVGIYAGDKAVQGSRGILSIRF